MATTTIKEFVVGLGWDVDDAGLAKFSAAIASATGMAVALGAAITATAGAVLAGVKGIAEDYDALDKLATRFRSTAEAVDEFQDMAQVLGLTKDQSIGSLKALDTAINDTALGLGRAKKVFEEIGLAVVDATGKAKPTVEVFDALAGKLQGMERGKQIRIMERLGLDPALLKLFSADLVGLRADLEAIDKAAGFDLGDAVTQSKAFMKTWKAMQQEWQKVTIVVSKLYESIAVKLMPALAGAVDDFRRRLESGRKFVMDNFGTLRSFLGGFVEFVIGVFGGMWQLVGRLFDIAGAAIKAVVDGLRSMSPELLKAAAGVGGLYAAWLLLNSALLASPVTWVLLLAGALLLLWDDYQTWKEGGDSLIDWGAWKEEIDLATAAIQGFKDFLTNAFTLIFAAVDGLASLLRGDFTGAWRAVGESVNAVIGIFKTAYEWVTKLVDAAAKLGGLGSNFTSRIGERLSTAASAQAGATGYDAMGNLTGFTPSFDGAGGGTVNTMNQQVSIAVTGNADPASTGRAVAGELGRSAADGVRNMKGSVR